MRRYTAAALALLIMAVCLNASAVTVWGYDAEDTNHVWTDNLYFQRVASETDLTFELMQFTNAAEWSRTKAGFKADGELPEALFKAELTLDETFDLQEKGVLMDLAPLIETCMPNLSALLAEHPDWRNAITMPDGTIPSLPLINLLHNHNAMWINQNWLQKLGLKVPETKDELVEVLRSFRDNDPNGNGKQDEIPMTFLGMWDLRFLSHAFGFIMDDYGLYLDENGKVQTALTDERNRELLSWLNTLWTEKLLDQNGFATSDTYRAITDEKATISYGIVMGPTPLNLLPSNALESYVLLPPLQSDDGSRTYRDLVGDLDRGTFALTVACKEPEKVLAWIDRLYSDEGMMLAFAGQEGVDYEERSDGTWGWLISEEEMYNSVRPTITILDGSAIPGFMSVQLQQRYDSAATRRIVDAIVRMREIAVRPLPLTVLTPDQQQEADRIQAELGKTTALAMTWFVTGETKMTDETWSAFCKQVEDGGINRLIEIFQSAIR